MSTEQLRLIGAKTWDDLMHHADVMRFVDTYCPEGEQDAFTRDFFNVLALSLKAGISAIREGAKSEGMGNIH